MHLCRPSGNDFVEWEDCDNQQCIYADHPELTLLNGNIVITSSAFMQTIQK